ncbi:unnamed protein product [Brassicogethes aeneus]|uniref:Uncharacterized protein n=1 Tax=Brassicogethes aeneus TaxID=1431903 RepID=A0A9P0FL06_BRAAE|nr:unnamed protein product [Brassicogethes aeneus]CAH0561429.1 unnamed protein product [Brassicogethes aeneus]
MSATLIGRVLQKGSREALKGARAYSKPTEAILRKNTAYQEDNGVPVYLKSGFGDKALFIVTATLIGMGVIQSYYTLISMAMGKKK